MKQKFYLLSLIGCLLTIFPAAATHVLGNEMRFTYIGKDSFLVTVDAYKDCRGINMLPLSVRVSGIGCSFSATYQGQQVSCKDVSGVCPSACSKCDPGNCNAYGYPNGANASCGFGYGIEKVSYQFTLVFPPSLPSTCCKYRVEAEQCCRPGSLTTCCANENFYNYMEMDRCRPNSSPVFSTPPLIVCAGSCVAWNFSGIDTIDYDSMSYHLVPALTGYGSTCTYVSPYTYKAPLQFKGFPNTKPTPGSNCSGLLLDSIEGTLFFTPTQQQVAPVVVEVKEWRYDSALKKRTLVSLTRRDLLLMVVANCTNNSPQMDGPFAKVVCAGEQVCFDTMKPSDPDSADSLTVNWNHSIPNAVFTKKQVGKYEHWSLCWQTTAADARFVPYLFTVSAQDNGCPLQRVTTRQYAVVVSRTPQPTLSATDLGCGKVLLKASPAAGKQAYNQAETYRYEIPYPGRVFGPGSQNSMDSMVVQFPVQGRNKFRFTMAYHDCEASLIDSIDLSNFPSAALSSTDSACKGMTTTVRAALRHISPPYTLYWNGQQSTADSFQFVSNGDTVIRFSLTDNSGCTFTDSVGFRTAPGCSFTFSGSHHFYVFRPVEGTTAQSYFWDFGDGDTSTSKIPSHTYAAMGNYVVTLITTGKSGCTDTCRQQVAVTNGIAKAIASSHIRLYPNPSTKHSTIEIEDAKPVQLRMFDMAGKCIWQTLSLPDGTVHKQHLTAQAAGIYLVSVVGSQGVYCLKWVVE